MKKYIAKTLLDNIEDYREQIENLLVKALSNDHILMEELSKRLKPMLIGEIVEIILLYGEISTFDLGKNSCPSMDGFQTIIYFNNFEARELEIEINFWDLYGENINAKDYIMWNEVPLNILVEIKQLALEWKNHCLEKKIDYDE